jgi:hypothetical protein
LPGRDLSAVITGSAAAGSFAEPVYFMTEDDVSRGLGESNRFTGKPFVPIDPCSRVESVIATLPTGDDGADELWKLNHYYERLDDWYAERGIAPNPFAGPAAEPFLELHNLTRDPEERANVASSQGEHAAQMCAILDAQRDAKRLLPSHRNS